MRNWSDVLPDDVAIQQHAYERAQMAWRMKQCLGLSNIEVGKKLGIGGTRAGILVYRGERYCGQLSPIERYFGPSGDVAEIYDLMNRPSPAERKLRALAKRKQTINEREKEKEERKKEQARYRHVRTGFYETEDHLLRAIWELDNPGVSA